MLHFKLAQRIVSLIAAMVMIFAFALQTAALEEKYRFDELKMAVSVPRDYYVITRDSDRNDDAFKALNLGYDETMIAFRNSDIWLRAYDPDQIFWLSVIVTTTDESKTINNYSDISASDRKDILENIKNEATVNSAVEVKHNNNIFFDSSGKTESSGRKLYFEQSNTVINGMQIDLVLQKYDEEINPSESKALTNMANSLEFDNIKRTTGPIFEWWRLLLWVAILAGLAFALSILYRQRNAANRRKLQERRHKREIEQAKKEGKPIPEEDRVTFDEALGYEDDEQFESRSLTDLDTYNIKVAQKDPNHGVSYFEDSGDSIDDGTDYFDTYFSEPAETRKGFARFFGTVGTYIKLGFKRLGYFFTNLKRKLFKKKK